MSTACTAPPSPKRAPAYTLIELLLAMFLLSLLFGALVFNFTALQPGSELTEGTDRFESLLRFARAQAAYCGCRVQLRFESGHAAPSALHLYRLNLAWEPKPLEQPGAFVDLPPASWDMEGINQVIGVARVSYPGISSPAPHAAEPVSGLESEPASGPDLASSLPNSMEDEAAELASITFFPDGTSDSAQIFLTARAEKDPRTVMVHLSGITGAISHEWLDETADESANTDEDWFFELLDEMTEAEPLP